MFSLIVAMAENGVIGKDNDMPWHYPEDLQYFKQVTMHKTVVMGRKTYESIYNRLKQPLPGRKNIVITRHPERFPEVECYPSVDEFLSRYQHCNEEIFIIGGAMLYAELLPYCERLYITKIHKSYEGDTYFPSFDKNKFEIIKKDERKELTFCIYERRVSR